MEPVSKALKAICSKPDKMEDRRKAQSECELTVCDTAKQEAWTDKHLFVVMGMLEAIFTALRMQLAVLQPK